MKTSRSLVLTSVGVALVLAGCSPAPSGSPQPTPTTSATTSASPSPSPTVSATATPTEVITSPELAHLANALTAIKTAEKHVGGLAIGIENLQKGWEVDVRTDDGVKWEVKVSTDGLTVTTSEPGNLDIADKPTVLLPQAIDIAMKNTTGHFDEAELESKSGSLFWQVSLKQTDTEVKVRVDAASGAVLGK